MQDLVTRLEEGNSVPHTSALSVKVMDQTVLRCSSYTFCLEHALSGTHLVWNGSTICQSPLFRKPLHLQVFQKLVIISGSEACYQSRRHHHGLCKCWSLVAVFLPVAVLPAARRVPIHQGAVCYHVHGTALDHQAVCWLLYCRGIQRLLQGD